jgi:hypothetical protein
MTKLAISLLFNEEIEWFDYIYSNYCTFIKMKFMLIINLGSQYEYNVMETFIKKNKIKNIILSEPFSKRNYGPDVLKGHMMNIRMIRNIEDIDYITFIGSDCFFFRELENIDPTVNVFNNDYFVESHSKTDLYDEIFNVYSNKFGMYGPNIHKYRIEQFNPDRNCFSEKDKGYEGANFMHKIANDYKIIKKTITKNNFYYGNFNFLTTNKSVIDKIHDFYWNNNLNKHFNKFDDWSLEEFFPINYFINNKLPFFYIGFNSIVDDVENDIKLLKFNKNNYYGLKLQNRSEIGNNNIIEFYNEKEL